MGDDYTEEDKLGFTKVQFEGAAKNLLEKAVKRHIETHTDVAFTDVVKMLYQSVLGSFHVLDHMDEKQIETWIREALTAVEPAKRPVTEKLYGKRWVRLDLGAFKHKNGNDYRLATQSFMKAKCETRVSQDKFRVVMNRLLKVVKDGKIKPKRSDLDLAALADCFLKQYERKGFLPLHHSEAYSKTNPQYLVVPSESTIKPRSKRP